MKNQVVSNFLSISGYLVKVMKQLLHLAVVKKQSVKKQFLEKEFKKTKDTANNADHKFSKTVLQRFVQ